MAGSSSNMMFSSRGSVLELKSWGFGIQFQGGGLDLTRWIGSVTRRLIATRDSDTSHQCIQCSTKGVSNGTKRLLVSNRPSPSNWGPACATGTIFACARRGAEDITQSTTIKGTILRYDSAEVYFSEYIRTVYIRTWIRTVCDHVNGRRDNATLLSKFDCTSHRLAAGPHHGPTIVFSGVRSMNINGDRFDNASNVNLHTVLSNLSHQATSSPGAPV